MPVEWKTLPCTQRHRLHCVFLLLNLMVPVCRERFHSQETVWHFNTDRIKSSTHLTAAVCLVFSVNFTAIYWWENTAMDAKIDIFLERRTNSIPHRFKRGYLEDFSPPFFKAMTNEPIIQVSPKLHTHWLTEAWFIAGCGHWRCCCASSGGTCHFLHSELLIGPLCISNETNVAATKTPLQSCGENGITNYAARVPSLFPAFFPSQFALYFPHSSSPLSLPWLYSCFYLSTLSCSSFCFQPQAARRQKKLFQVRGLCAFFLNSIRRGQACFCPSVRRTYIEALLP